MLKWYRISGSSTEGLRKVMHSLRNQRLMVRSENGTLVACVNDEHQVWLSRVCGDFGASLVSLEAAPEGARTPRLEEYAVPCGEKFYDPLMSANHQRYCTECWEASGKSVKKTAAPKAGPAVTAAVIEPGQNFNLDGVIASLEATKDRLYSHLETVEGLLTHLKSYKEAKEKITELGSEVKGRLDAVRLLVRDGKLG